MPPVDLVLDTDVLIEFLRGRPEAISWVESHSAQAVGIPVLVWMELLQGARDNADRDRIISRLAAHSILHLESGDTHVASAWFAAYWLSHRIGILDCLIAAIAVREGAPIYTFNTAHFRVIPGLDARSPYDRRPEEGSPA